MQNPETDALHLVETFSVPAGRWFIPPTVRNDVGYSLQIFSPTGQYRGEVTAEGMYQRAKQGDLVLRINLETQYTIIKGALKSADGFTRAYTLTVGARVLDPYLFAVLYRTSSDAIAQLRTAVDGQLQTWAERLTHEGISESAMRFWANQAATLRSAKLGLRVETVERATVDADPHFAELRRIELEEIQRQAQHVHQVTIAEENRLEGSKDDQAARSKVELDEQVKMKLAGQQQITQAMVESFTQRIREGLADNIPLTEIVAQDPALADWVNQLTASSPQALLSSASSSFPLTQDMKNVVSASVGATSPTLGREEREIPSLGIAIAATTLTNDQLYAAEQMAVEVGAAFAILRLEDSGPAAKCGFVQGDILIQVTGNSMQGMDHAAQVLRTAEPGTPVPIIFFRERALYELKPIPNPLP